MKSDYLLLCGLPLLLMPLCHAGSALAADSRPNIVFILADDLGGRDVGAYGSPWHRTPHLDRLAEEGVRFTQAYASAPICSASRVALLTGRSPARLQFEFVTKLPGTKVESHHPLQVPAYPLNLPLSEITVAEVLGQAGYRTGYYGKWHVSAHNGGYLNWSDTHGPLQQGFHEGEQEFGSHPYGDASRSEVEMAPFAEGDYGDDPLTNKARAFMQRHRDAPFFLWLSHYYVHTPVATRAKWLQRESARRLPPGTNLERATYAAMVETLDELVGQVLSELDELGIAENTLVIFTSDNGGHPQYAVNGPSRGSKWNVYEGGISVPFIVRWPGRLGAGTVNSTPINGTDLMPTLAGVAGVEPDPSIALDGVNLLPNWQQRGPVRRQQPMVWHFPFYHPESNFAAMLPEIGVNDFAVSQTHPQSAIRMGDYKLIHFYADERDELYHITHDPSELNDLSQIEPAKTAQLRTALQTYLKLVNARLPTRR